MTFYISTHDPIGPECSDTGLLGRLNHVCRFIVLNEVCLPALRTVTVIRPQSMAFEAHSLTVPSVLWLGLLPSDIQRFGKVNSLLRSVVCD